MLIFAVQTQKRSKMENSIFTPDKRRPTDEQLFWDLNNTLKRARAKIRVYSRNPYEWYEQNIYVSYYENGKRKQSAVYSVLDKYGIERRQIYPKLFAEVNKQTREVNQTTINQLYTALFELAAKLQSGTAAATAKKKTMLFDYVAQVDSEIKANGQTTRSFAQLLYWLQNTAQDCKLKDLNADYIKAFLLAIAANGLKKNTQATIFSTLRNVLNRAVQSELISESPLKRLGRQFIPHYERNAATIHYLDDKELRQFAECYATETDERTKKAMQIFLFQCLTGLRIGDVLALKWENINLKTNTIRLIEQKTAKIHVIEIIETAKNYLPKRPTNGGGLVFGGYFHNSARVNQLISKYDKQIGQHIHTHLARHTFATILLEVTNGNLVIVQKAVGHTTITTTEIYAQAKSKDRAAAMQKLDTFVSDFPQ